MSKHHRFTGRELSTLLEQVREELGSEATILEANKVLTGGVAGFFKTEKFEVIAAGNEPSIDLDAEDGTSTIRLDLIEADGSPAPDFTVGGHPRLAHTPRAESFDEAVAAVMNDEPVRRSRLFPDDDALDIRMFDSPSANPTPAASDPGIPTPGDRTALLERTDTISISDRIGFSQPAVAPETGRQQADRRFGDVLTNELAQPEAAARSIDPNLFWSRLEKLDTAVPALDLDSPIIAVVGNRSSALSVAKRIEAGAVGQRPALAAVTATPHDLDMPAWQLIDTMTELDDRLRFWGQADRRGVVIIDADLGDDAARTVEKVRSAGARVLHLTIDEELTPERIFSLMEKLGGNVVIDLTFRAAPKYVLDLLDRRVPLASVGGREVDAGLVFALEQAVHGG